MHLLTFRQKLYFHLKNPVLLHTLLSTFCSSVKVCYEEVKREIIKCSMRCFIQNKLCFGDVDLSADKLTSLKHNLPVFQGKTNTARLSPTRKSAPQLKTPATFLQQWYSSAANLSGRYCSKLFFLLFFLYSWHKYYCPISTILKAMASEQGASGCPDICWLVVGKKASTFSTYHGVTNYVKNGTARKIISSNRCHWLAAVSPTTTFSQVWESCSHHF